jgi:hypothetical protein
VTSERSAIHRSDAAGPPRRATEKQKDAMIRTIFARIAPLRPPLRSIAAASLAILAVAGCLEDPTGTVKGRVTFNGKPLPSGTVTFVFHGGRGVESARILPDGTYSLPEVPLGESRVTVQTPDPRRLPEGLRKALDGPAAENATVVARRDAAVIVPSVEIPKRYNDPETSGLTFTVMQGGNLHDLELTP